MKVRILCISLATILFFYGVFHFRLYKLLLNQGRLLKPVHATVLCDSQVSQKGLLYEYKDEYGDKMIFYLKGPTRLDRKVLVIDVDRQKIGVPNSSFQDYSLWGNHLFQNNSGENYIPLDNNVKRNYFDPNLIITSDEIRFELPPNEGYHCSEIVIHRKEI